MAETIYFNRPSIAAPEQIFEVLWYQSNDGINWDIDPMDKIEIALLETNAYGQFLWTSDKADPTRYHKIKGKTLSGVESDTGYILPPKSLLSDTDLVGINMSNNGEIIYNVGDKVDFILRVDPIAADTIGPTVQIDLLDFVGNVVGNVVADRVGDIYVAEWRIPLSIVALYNPANQIPNYSEASTTYLIRDRWILSDNSYMEFSFRTYKVPTNPISDNSQIVVTIRDIRDTAGVKSAEKKISFTTKINPYHCTVQDVRDLYYQLLSPEYYDNFTVARHIHHTSTIVDVHMSPDKIHNQQHFDLAKKNYVKYKAASLLIAPIVQINKEEKALDSFKIARESSDPKLVLDRIDAEVYRNQLIIWAGGKDTPFIPKTFEKGLYDPNRPNISRAAIDMMGWYPWVNATSQPIVMTIDGNDVEVRGERFISYAHIHNKYFKYDRGDAGYLSGI